MTVKLWRKTGIIFALSILLLPVFISTVYGHVPYLEHRDFTQRRPYEVRKSIEQSLAIYAWLKNDGLFACRDIDVYTFDVTNPVRVYLEVIVPVCPEYENFVPWFALVGPNLPSSQYRLPFHIPPGYGSIVMENVEPEARGTVASLTTMAWNFGWAFSPTISGELQVAYGFNPPFIGTITLYTVAIFLYWYFFWRNTRE